jgi:hypothetical protein
MHHSVVAILRMSGPTAQGHAVYSLTYEPLQGGGALESRKFVGEKAVGDFLRTAMHVHKDAVAAAEAELVARGEHVTGEVSLSDAEMTRFFPVQHAAMKAAG